MALTINTHPLYQQTNAPEFNVVTSLTEDSDYQNLRIRATIYAGSYSDPVAVLEQSQGLNDWDFFDTLKSLTGKCDTAPFGSEIKIYPEVSDELLTGWTDPYDEFSTFTTSGRAITSAIGTGGVYAMSNDLGSVVAGDILVIGLDSDYADTDTGNVKLYYAGSNASGVPVNPEIIQYAGLSSNKLQESNIYYFLVTEDSTTPYIFLGNESDDLIFSGTISIHKITNFRNNPALYFDIKFEEVYENASNVTTIGDESLTDALLYFPVTVQPGEDFTDDYLMTSGTAKSFLSRSSDAVKFVRDNEMRFMIAANIGTTISHYYIAGSSAVSGTPVTNCGWCMFCLNETAVTFTGDPTTVTCRLYESASLWSTTIILDVDNKCYPDVSAINFVGDLGEETIFFKGLSSTIGGSGKTFYKDSNRVRKVLKTYKSFTKVLRTLYESEDLYSLLHELTYTEIPVWELNTDFTAKYREVTVITDSVSIEDENKLFANEIEIDYYE